MQVNRVVIVGDLFPVTSNSDRFAEGDVGYLFGEEICNIFSMADYRICNLEGALTDNPGKCEKTGPIISAPAATIQTYKQMGINCCTLANNHITDAGSTGVLDTMRTLDEANINHIGAGKNSESIQHHLFFQIGTKRFCLYNVAETMYNAPSSNRPGAYLYDEYIVCHELESLKSDCDYLIVVYHGGAEKFRYPSPQTRRRFHRMVDSGANMILSQHTHCVGCEEYYNGAYLLYGQGNFLFRSFNNEFTDTGLIIELVFDGDDITINKYMVEAVGDTVRLAEIQDFASFNSRSARVYDEDFVNNEFKKYCEKEAFNYLESYKGIIPFQRIIRRLFPKCYRQLILKSYKRDQLLFTLHSLRSEQNRETAIEGIKELLKKYRY